MQKSLTNNSPESVYLFIPLNVDVRVAVFTPVYASAPILTHQSNYYIYCMRIAHWCVFPPQYWNLKSFYFGLFLTLICYINCLTQG